MSAPQDLSGLFKFVGVAASAPAWFAEPPTWTAAGTQLTVRPAAETDFWSRTHYGFVHHNGHFLSVTLPRDSRVKLTCAVSMLGDLSQYDQAGLMVHLDEVC